MSPHVHFDHGSLGIPGFATLTLLLAASLYLARMISTRSGSAPPFQPEGQQLPSRLVLVWMAWGIAARGYDHSC